MPTEGCVPQVLERTLDGTIPYEGLHEDFDNYRNGDDLPAHIKAYGERLKELVKEV